MKYNIKNYKNKVIRIISQKIKVNYKEPYKLLDATSSICTGFFIKGNYIITCSHCLEYSKDIYIEIPESGKQKYKAEIVGLCPMLDIAILKPTEYKSKEYFTLSDSDKVSAGDKVFAVGYPAGQNAIKSSSGIISGRQNGNLQMDTPVNPGNSGGPLVHNNKVVGIVSSGMSKHNNIGYAIPINKYYIIKTELYDKKQVLILRNEMDSMFDYNNTDDNLLSLYNAKNGIFITDTRNMGNTLQKDDILVSINNNKIDNYGFVKSRKLKEKIEVGELLDYIKLGDKISIEYIRNKKTHKQSFTYKYNDFAIRDKYPQFEIFDYEILDGIVLTELSLNYMRMLNTKDKNELNNSLMKYYYNKDRGTPIIIVSFIYPNTSISNLDLLVEGDRITKCNNIEVNTIEEFRKAAIQYTMIKKKKYILFETAYNEQFIIDVKQYIDKSNNNRDTFKYPVTPLFKLLEKT